MRRISIGLLFLMLCAASALALTPETRSEIEHLLRFVENTSCQYNRNGETHAGKAAAGHIRKKYDYFKDDVDTAEKFIELSATKSTLSGKYYTVQCEGVPDMRSQQWLLQELERYRNGGSE